MSPRVSLGELAQRSASPVEPTPTAAEDRAPKRDEVPRGEHPRKSRSARPAPRDEDSEPGTGWQRFDAYERKETRLRPDQYSQLTMMARAIMRSREGGTGERITENTLIRVAIDLLMSRGSDLTGVTEAELRKSVGL